MKETTANKILDNTMYFLEEHPLVVTIGFCGATMLLWYKIQEACIRNAIRKANIDTVEYILEQFRYIRH